LRRFIRTPINALQEDFEPQVANNNIIFHIPTPTFGAGLIEMIPDTAIEANRQSQTAAKALFGISGRANRNGNDGTIARFGWKAHRTQKPQGTQRFRSLRVPRVLRRSSWLVGEPG